MVDLTNSNTVCLVVFQGFLNKPSLISHCVYPRLKTMILRSLLSTAEIGTAANSEFLLITYRNTDARLAIYVKLIFVECGSLPSYTFCVSFEWPFVSLISSFVKCTKQTRTKVSISFPLFRDRKWGVELQQKLSHPKAKFVENLNMDVRGNVTFMRLNLTLKQRKGKV